MASSQTDAAGLASLEQGTNETISSTGGTCLVLQSSALACLCVCVCAPTCLSKKREEKKKECELFIDVMQMHAVVFALNARIVGLYRDVLPARC